MNQATELQPHNREAERSVLGAILNYPAAIGRVAGLLRPADFWNLEHRNIFQAMARLAKRGDPCDILAVESELNRMTAKDRRIDYLNEVGGLDYLHDLGQAVESAGNVEYHAGLVREAAQLRRIIEDARKDAEEAARPGADPADMQRRQRERLGDESPVVAQRVEWVGVSEILSDLEPVEWLIEGIQLAAGRPFMLAGFGGSMKTLTCQALAVAAAAGKPIWGHFPPARALHVRHVDWEQGLRDTRSRYQRLMFADNLHADDIGDRLQLVSFPPINLSKPEHEAAWRRAAEGCDILILDSLRAMTPGVDENSSDIRRCLDPLTKISSETGCAIVLIHHAKKLGKQENGEERLSTAERVRGSSGIFDACGAVFFLDGRDQEPRKVEQVKTPAGAAGGSIKPFWLTVTDIPNSSGNMKAGVQLRYSVDGRALPLSPEKKPAKV
jgi:hypothetical protein